MAQLECWIVGPRDPLRALFYIVVVISLLFAIFVLVYVPAGHHPCYRGALADLSLVAATTEWCGEQACRRTFWAGR